MTVSYDMNHITFVSRVGRLNPKWNDEDKSEERENSQFRKAMELGMTHNLMIHDSLYFSWN